MNISGIRPVDGFYDYNRIMSIAPVAEPPKSEAEVEVKPVKSGPSQEEIDAARAKQTFGQYDYAAQYDPTASYGLKGERSELKSLDVEKAISDMEKDQAIHQYQYFVGDKQQAGTTVSRFENFSL